MSDIFPNTPGDPMNSPENKDDLKFEFITAYIDSQLNDSEKEKAKNLIDSDSNVYNRYIFEKLTKENLQQRLKNPETPLYVYQNIGNGIEDYIKKNSKKESAGNSSDIYQTQIDLQKSNLKRYLFLSSLGFIFLIAAAFLFNSYLKRNPDLIEKDLVAVSRNVFDKVEAGQIDLQFKSDNAQILEDSMDKYLDFESYIPEVKDAVLIGGVCNEINGEKLAHFVHKKGNLIIYTLEANKKDIIEKGDKLFIAPQFKDNVISGKNWFACNKNKNRTAVIWYKDNVICSTIADMDCNDITAILTNYK